ncbi:MAG TPA: glycosyltransferase, partial [Miltoncostaeaceae bacterium]|nr:glycosyltransferase [Miltoncostaeaceae bacterium]
PGHLLRAANPEVADMCDVGRGRLGDLRGRTRVLIAYSAFNAADLRAAGLGEPVVMPLLLDAAPPPPPPPPDGPPVLLTVGRIAPNKRLEDVMRVTALLQRAHAPDASLLVVGAADSFEPYRDALAALGRRVGLRNVRFLGRVPDAALRAAYSGAHAYLCMSVHEGFCVPVVEAMQHGLPVVARAAGAVPETLGGAGIALGDEDPAVFAEALWEVVRPGRVRDALRAAMPARLAELAPERTAARLRAALAPLGVAA